MIEIIVIIAGIAVLILTPIEVKKVKNGWTRKNFKGTPAEFLTVYRNQLTMMMWIGAGLGLAYIALGVIEERQYEDYVKFGIAAIWLAVGAVSYFSREKLGAAPPPAANS